jgi:HSP20 family protein
VLTVRAERKPAYGEDIELQAHERPRGTFSRQLFLSDTLDLDGVEAHYDAGVLTLHIPVVEKAKARKIEITGGDQPKEVEAA